MRTYIWCIFDPVNRQSPPQPLLRTSHFPKNLSKVIYPFTLQGKDDLARKTLEMSGSSLSKKMFWEGLQEF